MIQPPHSGERPQWCQVQAVYSRAADTGNTVSWGEECQPPVSPHREWLMVASTFARHTQSSHPQWTAQNVQENCGGEKAEEDQQAGGG